MLQGMNQRTRIFSVELGDTKLRAVRNEEGIWIDGRPVEIEPGRRLRGFSAIDEAGRELPIYVEEGDDEHEYVVYIRGEAVRMRLVTERDERLRHLRKNTASAASGAQMVTAPMPGLLKGILVAEGDVVEKGTSLCILEAMKMENEIKSPGAFLVKRLVTQAGTAVEKGTPLVELGPVPEQ